MAFTGNTGTNGADNYEGSAYQTLYGLDGDDRIVDTYLGGSTDTIYGGNGNDFILGQNFTTFLGTGAAGSPFLITGFVAETNADVIYGDEGRDAIYGAGGDDTLYGGGGNDSGNFQSAYNSSYYLAGLWGGDGADFMDGGTGDDLLDGGTGNDTMFGGVGNGNDTMYGFTGDDRMYGQGGSDFLFGDIGSDVVSGNDGNDDVRGGSGIDGVFGGEGNDYLIGGTNVGAGDGFTDYFYAFDGGTNTNETDFILDFEDTQFGAAANDFIVLEQAMAENTLIFDANGYTWIAVGTATGFHYLGATGTSASAIVNNITYV